MPALRTKTEAYNGVTLTVRERLSSDVFDEFDLLNALPDEGKRAKRRRDTFVACINRTQSVSGLPFTWATPDSSDEDVRACYENWRRLEEQLLIRWANALIDVNKADDPELAPTAPGEASALP